jgi:hypothetical protein
MIVNSNVLGVWNRVNRVRITSGKNLVLG